MFPLYISLSHHFWVKMDRGSGLCSLGFPTAAFSLLHPGLNTCGWMRTSPKWPLEAMPQRIFCLSQRMCAKSLQSCLTPCKPMTSLPGSSVYGILQARILEWVAMPSSKESFQPRDRNKVSHIAGRFFTIWDTREARWVFVPVLLILSGLVITNWRKNFQEKGYNTVRHMHSNSSQSSKRTCVYFHR